MRIADRVVARFGVAAWKAALAAVLLACALLPIGRSAVESLREMLAALSAASSAASSAESPRTSSNTEALQPDAEWPAAWDGRPLRPLALGAVEQRFAAQFPGHIARLTDGEQIFVWRSVTRPTRMLHPAADCYRGLGYRIEQARLERDAQARLWRCFIAERGGQRVRGCERIEGADGQSFTDTSSWSWAAQLGQARGPWQAVTMARPL